MTREDVIRWAREVRLYLPYWDEDENPEKDPPRWTMVSPLTGLLERFAALVAEKEREECAKVCDNIESDMWEQYRGKGKYAGVASSKIGSADIAGNSDGACKCAEAIRARGKDE